MADFGAQPVDYSQIASFNPLAAQAQAVQIQNQQVAGQQAQLQMQMQRLALQRQMSFGQDLQGYIHNPTPQGLASLFGKYPEFEKQSEAARGALDRGDITQLGSAAALAAKGQYDGAAQIIQERIDAEKANGTDTTQSQHVLDLLKSGDPQQQKAAVGMLSLGVGIAVGPEKAADFLEANGLSAKPVDLAMDHRLVTQQGQTIVGGSPKLEAVTTTNADGSSTAHTFNPQTGVFGAGAADGSGAPTTGGGGPASGGGVAAPAGAPRSVRNNNPGNLRATPFTRNQPGFQGVDSAGYAIFDNPQSGTNAQAALLSGKAYFGGGRQTVASIVSKWAPSKTVGGDNTPAQTANYIKYVAQSLGVAPNQKLTPAQLPALAQAMQRFEAGATGRAGPVRVPGASAPQAVAQPQGNSPYEVGGTQGGLNTKGAEPGHAWNANHTGQIPVPGTDADPQQYQAEIDPAARNWLYTNQFPTGSGGMGGGGQLTLGEKNAIVKRAMQLWTSAGHSPEELKTFRSQYAGLNTSLQQATTTLSSLTAAEDGLKRDANLVLSTHKPLVQMGIIGDHGALGGLVSNSWANNTRLDWYETHGSPQQQAAVKAYKDAVNAYASSYSKFMTAANGIGGSGAPSDAARNQAGELNDEGLGPTALRAHLQTVLAEAENKRQGWQHQVALVSNKLNSLGNLPGSSSAGQKPVQIHSLADYNALSHGAHYIDPNGVPRTKK